MFPGDEDIAAIKRHIFDPFEYLALRHKAGLMRTDFKRPLGKVAYHVACHLRVQNIGLKTRDVLQLIPGTTVEPIERCSGHNGTYGVKTAISRHLDEDRQAGFRAGAGERRRFLRKRLPDGRPSNRKRPEERTSAHPSVDAAQNGLRLVETAPCKSWHARDLMSLEQYASERSRMRAEVMAHKQLRNVQVGPNMMWCFEDRTTIRYQILEMLRAERIFESEGIQERAGRLQSSDTRRQQLEGDTAARVPGSRRAAQSAREIDWHRRPMLGSRQRNGARVCDRR